MFKYGLLSLISKWRPICDVSVSSSIQLLDMEISRLSHAHAVCFCCIFREPAHEVGTVGTGRMAQFIQS